MELGEHQLELALCITRDKHVALGGLTQEGAKSSERQEGTGDAVAETREIMPGQCQEEGGISEKESRAGHTEDFNRKDSKGQSRKKEGFAQIPCDRKGPKPPTRFSVWRMKTQLSST